MLAALFAALVAQLDAPTAGPAPAPAPDDLAARLEAEIPGLLADSGEPGLALVLVDGGGVALCRGFGLADREAETPVDADTLFNVGSISKTVTAWGVMHLVEAGALDLDAPVGPRLERWSFPESGHDVSGVTVRRLLRHTAGVSQPSIGGYEVDEELPTLEQELGRNVRLIAEPGTRFDYSGGGYTVLQLLVEETAGEPFERAMQELVLGPLGMDSSRFGWVPSMAERAATPYTTRVEEGRDATGHVRWRQRAFVGVAGAGLYTSARDLGRFLAAHCEGPDGEPAGRGVLRPETLRAMAEVGDVAPGRGLGYEVPPPAGDHVILMHGGDNVGWRAQVMIAPDLGLAIGVLTNTDGHAAMGGVLLEFRDEVLARVAREEDER